MAISTINNTTLLWGDDLKKTLNKGSKVQIAASCFSIYAYEALKNELEEIDSLKFIFTTPTAINNKVSEKIAKNSRQYHIPKHLHEKDLYGSEFEIELRNKLKQKAIAIECASWIKRKAAFKTNIQDIPMQQLANIGNSDKDITYFPIQGFTTSLTVTLNNDFLFCIHTYHDF